MGELVWGRLFPSFLEGSTYLDEEEALKQGYDFEANRRFFHPLGLCLVTRVTDEGLRFRLLDGRKRPEGFLYDSEPELAFPRQRLIANVRRQWVEKAQVRLERFGFIVQPAASFRDTRLLYATRGPAASSDPPRDA